MLSELIIGAIVAGSWLYNLYCWVRGFALAGHAFIDKEGKGNRFHNAFVQLMFTMADLGAVGLVRYLIGTYASVVVPSSILAIAISFWIGRMRSGKSKIFDPPGSTSAGDY